MILVTHSMGGLVARAAVHLDGFAEQVLGVVHGVQPVTGSPEGYWRMRGGFRGEGIPGAISNRVLGRRGIEVTALLGNMPGGLQLLPNKAYRIENDPRWLRLLDPRGTQVEARPMSGDPYAEIYRERDAYWRLIDESLLDPGGSAGQPPPCPYLGPADSPWDEYLRLLRIAEQFHDWLGLAHHPRTRSFYGSGTKNKTSAQIAWKMRPDYVARSGTTHARSRRPRIGRPVEDADLLWPSTGPHEVAHFVYRSPGVEAHIASPSGGAERATRLLEPNEAGDGTVPEDSATGLPLPPMSNTPPDDPTPRPFEPGQAAFPGLEHEPAYGDKARGTGPPDFALTAIADLCRHLL